MAKYSTPRILPQRGGLRLSDQQRKAATIWYNWYAGGGEIDYENLIIESLPNFWVRADAPTVDKAGNYTPAVVNSPTVVDEAINGQPAINLVASEQNGIHIGAVSNFTQFTAVCFFKCDDTSLNGLLFDCYSSASAF